MDLFRQETAGGAEESPEESAERIRVREPEEVSGEEQASAADQDQESVREL